MSGRSVDLTTLFLGRLRPRKRFPSTSCTTALLESAEGETKVCGRTRYRTRDLGLMSQTRYRLRYAARLLSLANQNISKKKRLNNNPIILAVFFLSVLHDSLSLPTATMVSTRKVHLQILIHLVFKNESMYITMSTASPFPTHNRVQVIKLFPCSTQLSMKFYMLIYIKI